MLKKKYVCVILLFAIVFLAPFANVASAEEIWPGYHLRWDIRDGNGNYRTAVNGDLLNGAASMYSGNVSTATSHWNSSATKASSAATNFNSSNVDLATASSSWWKEHVNQSSVLAITVPSYNGKQVFSPKDFGYSKDYVHIKYSGVFFNPSSGSSAVKNVKESENKQTNVIMHEMGHVYGMGHVNNSGSLMYKEVTTRTSLASHDITVMNGFYH